LRSVADQAISEQGVEVERGRFGRRFRRLPGRGRRDGDQVIDQQSDDDDRQHASYSAGRQRVDPAGQGHHLGIGERIDALDSGLRRNAEGLQLRRDVGAADETVHPVALRLRGGYGRIGADQPGLRLKRQ